MPYTAKFLQSSPLNRFVYAGSSYKMVITSELDL